MSTFFALTTTWKWFLFGLYPRVTFKHFLSTFFKCHTFLAELSWSVPLPSGGSLLAEFWLISDVIFLTIESLSLLSHSNQSMMPLPLMEEPELDNLTRVWPATSQLFEQKQLKYKKPNDWLYLVLYGRLFSLCFWLFLNWEPKQKKCIFFPRLKQSSIFSCSLPVAWWFSWSLDIFSSFQV